MKTTVQKIYATAAAAGATVAKIGKTYALVITAQGGFVMLRFQDDSFRRELSRTLPSLEHALACCAAIDAVDSLLPLFEPTTEGACHV